MLNVHWYRELDLVQITRPPEAEDLLEARDATGSTLADMPAGVAGALVSAGGLARIVLATASRSSSLALEPELVPGVRLTRTPEGVVLDGDWGRLTHLELQVVAWPAVLRWQIVRDAQRSYEVLLPAPGGARAWHELHVAGCAGDQQGPSFGAWVEPAVPVAGSRWPGLEVAFASELAAVRANERTRALPDQLPAAVLASFGEISRGADDVPRLLERWLERPEAVAGERHHAQMSRLVASWPAGVAPRVWTARTLAIAAMHARPEIGRWFGAAPIGDVERALAALASRPDTDALAWAVERLGVVPSSDPEQLAALQRSSHELGLSAALRWLEEVAAGPGLPAWRFEPDTTPRDGGLSRRAAFANDAMRELVEAALAAGPAVELVAGDPEIAAAAERLKDGVARARAALAEAAGPALSEITGPLSAACDALAASAVAVAVRRLSAAARAWMGRQAQSWRRKLVAGDRNVEDLLDRLEAALNADDPAPAVVLLGEVEQALRGHASARFDVAMASLAELERVLGRLRAPQRERVQAALAALLDRPAWPALASGCPLGELVELLQARGEALGREDRRPSLAQLTWLEAPGTLAADISWAAGLETDLERLAGDGTRRREAVHRLHVLRGRLAARGGAAGWRLALLGQLALRLERLARALPAGLAAELPAMPPRRGGHENALLDWLHAALATAGVRAGETWPVAPAQSAELKRALEASGLVPA